MDIYGLFSIGNNDMDYEDAISWNDFIGVFTSVEEAKNYAEKKLNALKEDVNKHFEYRGSEMFIVIEDWHWDNDGSYRKRVEYPEHGTFDDEYVIEKLTINPEFKED